MIRLDHDTTNNGERYFSDSTNIFGDGDGDIAEIRNRQSWKQIGHWISDSTSSSSTNNSQQQQPSLEFGKVSRNNETNEYVPSRMDLYGNKIG